jgi:riboflavin synthase
MFTGLVEAVGCLTSSTTTPAGRRVRIRTGLAAALAAGESVAVNGVCLTVAMVAQGEIEADLGPETLLGTTLGTLVPPRAVNLERALAADGRLGGHLVQGHVDATGVVEAMTREPDARGMTIVFPQELAPWLVLRGSVAVDGISLTVARLGASRFDIMIVPFTWDHTNLSTLGPGDRVNLECDMVGKYVARAVELFAASGWSRAENVQGERK